MILRTALLLVLIAPGSAFADASDPSPSCTAATVFQVSQGSAVTAHSGGYYAARQMSFSVTPESWSALDSASRLPRWM